MGWGEGNNDMRFEAIVGYPWDFHGVDNNRFVIGTHGRVVAFEALEDPDDGYRSMLENIEAVALDDVIYSRIPLATVTVVRVDHGSFEGYDFVDVADGHVWLQVGTDHMDDYY